MRESTFTNAICKVESKQISKDFAYCEDALGRAENAIGNLPSAQPEKRKEKRMETHACDLIDREAAVDAIYHHLPSVSRTRARTMLHEVPSAQPERKGWVHIDDIYRLIAGHSNYHGDNILSALTCLAEGKKVSKPIRVLDTERTGELPSAQPERKKGKWVHGREIAREMVGDAVTAIFYEGWQCSECKCIVEEEREPLWNFCPSCGADMRGEDDG